MAPSKGYAICERPVLSILFGLARNAIDYAAYDGETFFDAAQNAPLVVDAEQNIALCTMADTSRGTCATGICSRLLIAS